MKNPLLAAVAATFAATALAGPYDQPYAIVESGSKSEVRKEVPAAVTKVDGASTKNPRRSDPIPPGLHKVTVAFESAKGQVGERERVLDMNLEPCTRYRVVAKVENATRPEWEPKVYPEPIGECKKKFGTPAAGK
ncbi:MAG: hypothetical protein IPJ28_18185 [Betaproteobacteria bacterium]|nr:hypothetical protein [Betaproteobacteria bacterium]